MRGEACEDTALKRLVDNEIRIKDGEASKETSHTRASGDDEQPDFTLHVEDGAKNERRKGCQQECTHDAKRVGF